MNTDYNAERRCRYRLAKHGLKLHKKYSRQAKEYYFAIYENGDSVRDIPADSYMKLVYVVDYCFKLELSEREYRNEHKY